jgi:hypothetical protein
LVSLESVAQAPVFKETAAALAAVLAFAALAAGAMIAASKAPGLEQAPESKDLAEAASALWELKELPRKGLASTA